MYTNITYRMMELVLEMTFFSFQICLTPGQKILNTAWSSCLEISDINIAQQVVRPSRDLTLRQSCRLVCVTFLHLTFSDTVKFSLLSLNSRLKRCAAHIFFACEYVYSSIQNTVRVEISIRTKSHENFLRYRAYLLVEGGYFQHIVKCGKLYIICGNIRLGSVFDWTSCRRRLRLSSSVASAENFWVSGCLRKLPKVYVLPSQMGLPGRLGEWPVKLSICWTASRTTDTCPLKPSPCLQH